MNNIDRITFLTLLILLFSAITSSSNTMGALALIFSALVLFKKIVSLKPLDFSLKPFQKAILIYFLIITVSLLASSLFKLSLHGYIKTFIYIAFFLIVLIFTNKDLKYSLLNLLSIIPSILITRGIVRLYINKNKILFSILIFIGLLFIITLPGLIFSEKYNILTHIIGIIKSPIEFFTILAEGMKSYEE